MNLGFCIFNKCFRWFCCRWFKDYIWKNIECLVLLGFGCCYLVLLSIKFVFKEFIVLGWMSICVGGYIVVWKVVSVLKMVYINC